MFYQIAKQIHFYASVMFQFFHKSLYETIEVDYHFDCICGTMAHVEHDVNFPYKCDSMSCTARFSVEQISVPL